MVVYARVKPVCTRVSGRSRHPFDHVSSSLSAALSICRHLWFLAVYCSLRESS